MREMIILACMALLGCSEINKKLDLEDDNPFEEIVEIVIYNQTGLAIDLTPESDEDGI